MTKLALAIAALTTALPLVLGRAEAQPLSPIQPPPKVAQPSETTTTTTTTTVSTPAPTPAPPSQITASGTTTPVQGTATPIHAVFLHAGPTGEAPVIGTLHPGEPLRVLASAPGGWMQVDSPQGSGWAFGSYLAPGGAPSAQITSP
jgi:hypothetical protein